MKLKKLLVPCVLLLALILSGCVNINIIPKEKENPTPPSSPETPTNPATPETSDGKTQIKNPMKEVSSAKEMKEVLQFTFDDLPDQITNSKFFVIDNLIAQVNFNKDIAYIARKAKKDTVDISGVYNLFRQTQTITDKEGQAVLYQYNEAAEGLATWTKDSYNYSLYCPTAFNLKIMEALVDDIE